MREINDDLFEGEAQCIGYDHALLHNEGETSLLHHNDSNWPEKKKVKLKLSLGKMDRKKIKPDSNKAIQQLFFFP